MKQFIALFLIAILCFALAGCNAPEPDSGLMHTEEFRDTAEVVDNYYRASSEDSPAVYQLILKYRYTNYNIDVSSDMYESTEVGSSKDVIVTQKCFNYGVDTWHVVLAGE